jgi:hypothetical protein
MKITITVICAAGLFGFCNLLSQEVDSAWSEEIEKANKLLNEHRRKQSLVPLTAWQEDWKNERIPCIYIGKVQSVERGAISIINRDDDTVVQFAKVKIKIEKLIFISRTIQREKMRKREISLFINEINLETLGATLDEPDRQEAQSKLFLLKIPNAPGLGSFHIAYTLDIDKLEGLLNVAGWVSEWADPTKKGE